jgi:hypothetical protein
VGICIIGIPMVLVTLFGALTGGDGLLGGLLGEGGEEAGEAGVEAEEAGGGLLEGLLGEGGLEEICSQLLTMLIGEEAPQEMLGLLLGT